MSTALERVSDFAIAARCEIDRTTNIHHNTTITEILGDKLDVEDLEEVITLAELGLKVREIDQSKESK